MGVIAAFLRRDLDSARATRAPFLLDVAGTLVTTAVFYFIAHLVSVHRLGDEAGTSGGYFGYAIVGIALLRALAMGLGGFARAARSEQASGGLEILVASGAPVPAIAVGLGMWEVLRGTAVGAVTLAAGALLFGLHLPVGIWTLFAVAVVLPLCLTVFVAAGILLAALAIQIREVTSVLTLVTSLIALLGAVYYPRAALPPALRAIADASPFSWCMESMRAALLDGHADLARLGAIAAVGAASLALALAAFQMSVSFARRDGRLLD